MPLRNTYMVMEDHGFLVVVGKEAKMSQMVYIYSANESMVESPVDGSARRQLILPAMCVELLHDEPANITMYANSSAENTTIPYSYELFYVVFWDLYKWIEFIQTHIRLVGFRFVSPGWCIGTMGEKDIQDKQKRWQQNFDIDRTLTLTQEKAWKSSYECARTTRIIALSNEL